MAANPFTSVADYVDKPKRNTFDLSFANNLTMRFGRLYPVFCKEVVPGDSFRITPSFGLRFMPMVFPVQTRMKANLHFFYVRNRNLWKDWPDFIGRTKQGLIPPYLSPLQAVNLCRTGALGDYMGLPTTYVGDYASIYNLIASDYGNLCAGPTNIVGNDINWLVKRTKEAIDSGNVEPWRSSYMLNIMDGTFNLSDLSNPDHYFTAVFNEGIDGIPTQTSVVGFSIFHEVNGVLKQVCKFSCSLQAFTYADSYSSAVSQMSPYTGCVVARSSSSSTLYDRLYLSLSSIDAVYSIIGENGMVEDIASSDLLSVVEYLRTNFGDTDYKVGFFQEVFRNDRFLPISSAFLTWPFSGLGYYKSCSRIYLQRVSGGVEDVYNLESDSPYFDSSLRISALPFRAYESIYNAFYRNQFNDPFILNGQKEFNKFITNNEGGEDNHMYGFFNRNWEMDFLTSAKQTPVDGDVTPLVGVTGTGKFKFQNSDGTTYEVTPVLGSDGNTLTGIDSVSGTPENNSGLRRLTDLISVGISINDFRNVNALQRWLETNLRRGYRYKDQLMSHFGVDARYETLDMPEFIGGMSEPIIVNQISQMVDNTGNSSGLGDFSKVLGSYAGQASLFAQSNHDISKYCDEHGFIIGIMSIAPVPNYSQLLPKMFIKDNVLDYYFPEFGHIGNQPITYKEVCPIQAHMDEGTQLTDVFGYQRAWYDYLSSVDETHGDFRTSLDGFLINRLFNEKPELSKSFIEVDNDSMSNPFSVTGDGDKILGQIYFQVEAQRPIPKYGIPRLE